jgi:hypothetical protein
VKRVHEGCGTDNPFPKWFLWAASSSGAMLSMVLVLATGSWWGELGWLATPAVLSPWAWWEFVHAPSKMYRTWWP